MKILNQFKKIDAPWVLEVITERFDFLPIDAMTNLSVIYGGAIRDSIAGIALRGDLDIVVSPRHYKTVVNAINSSSRWSRICRDVPMPTRRPKRKPSRECMAEVIRSKDSPYGKHLPLTNVTRFVNVQGIELEIVLAKHDLAGEESGVIAVPAKVDMVCCGLVMDRGGDIYEVVESAYEDCKNRILRFNESVTDIVDIPRMEERIKKLEKRGWKSEIKILGIKKRQAKAKKLAEAEAAKKGKKPGKSKQLREKDPPNWARETCPEAWNETKEAWKKAVKKSAREAAEEAGKEPTGFPAEIKKNIWFPELLGQKAKKKKKEAQHAKMYGGVTFDKLNTGGKRTPAIPAHLKGRSAEWYGKKYNELSAMYTKLMADRDMLAEQESKAINGWHAHQARKSRESVEHHMKSIGRQIDLVTKLMRAAPKTGVKKDKKWSNIAERWVEVYPTPDAPLEAGEEVKVSSTDEKAKVNVKRITRPDGSFEYSVEDADSPQPIQNLANPAKFGDAVELFGDAKDEMEIKVGRRYHKELEELYGADAEYPRSETDEVEHTSPEVAAGTANSFIGYEAGHTSACGVDPGGDYFTIGTDEADPKPEEVAPEDYDHTFAADLDEANAEPETFADFISRSGRTEASKEGLHKVKGRKEQTYAEKARRLQKLERQQRKKVNSEEE